MNEPENEPETPEGEITERVFFCTQDGAHKFWRVLIRGEMQTVSWGRIGTAGQLLVRSFAGGAEVQAATDTLIAQKIAKGYVEVSLEEAAQTMPVPVTRAASGEAGQLSLFDQPAFEEAAEEPDAAAPTPATPPSLFD